jgi:hypothetical protein
VAFVPETAGSRSRSRRDQDVVDGQAQATERLDRAILRTVTYAALFRSPLSLARLHRALMEVPADLERLRARLEAPFLRQRLALTDGFVHPRGCEEWLQLRDERQRHTEELLGRHASVLRLLTRFPFVRLVALSGGCAHDNATDGDVDVFLIVRRGRAWAVCLALMLLSKLLGVRRTLCLNYIVDESGARLPEHDLFTAAEIMGMKPLAGRDAYRRFVAANAWVADWYPNFFASPADDAAVGDAGAPRWLEGALDLGPAPLLEIGSRRLLGAYLRRKARGLPGVVLAAERLKLHMQDHGPGLRTAFAEATAEAEQA